ncbi:MAG TPA: FeoA family protein [Clostridia bacterium]|nr:FeoA family protein [Clostridia bacterium]
MKGNSLISLKEGQCAKVECLLSNDLMRRRLQDIGLTEGASVECVLKGPSGDPIAYLIKGAIFALRSEDCKKVIVAS